MPEISHFAILVLVVSGGLSLAVLATKLADVVPVPTPLVFLIAAALASDASAELADALSIQDVERIAVVALIVILLNGGMDIGWRRTRESVGSILSLGILGTFATAGIVAVAAHVLLGFDWTLAGIMGAALAPTDPAVMFSVLGQREIRGRTGTMLEGEAGFNDPAGIALMIGMIELATHDDASFSIVISEFALEMAIGGALGAAGGWLLIRVLHRIRLGSEPLYPVLVLLLGAVLYGVASVAGGSGFLAVFVAGLLLGDAEDIPQRRGIVRFHSSVAGLGEVVVFLALGLTIGLTDLSWQTWRDGLALAAVIAVVARPAAVGLTLVRARLSGRERAFVMWAGLKGAVPILLAAFAIIGDVPGAEDIYGVVFVVVAVSVLIQGTLVPRVASALDVAA